MRNKIVYLLFVVFISSCTINRQVKEIKTLEKCTFSLGEIESLQVANTDINKIIQSGEINLAKLPSLALGYLTRSIPVKAKFKLNIANPTQDQAAINQFDYKILINNYQLIEGTMDQSVQIPAGDSTTVPLDFSFNIYEFLADESIRDDIQAFLKSSKNNEAQEAQLTIQIRPSILIANKLVKYPSFINIKKELTNEFLLK